MAAQQQLEQELQGLLQACQAAPRYGANGRFLILQVARNIEEYEAENEVAAVAWPPPGAHDTSAAAAAAGTTAAPAAADISYASTLSASTALELVPPKERPFVAFVPRSFLTQAVRQQVVNRLTGAFLLTLVESLQLPPQQHSQVIASSPLLRKAAGSAALEVERGLYRRITSPAAYQQQAPGLQAEVSLVPRDTWQQLVTQLAPQLVTPPAAAPQPGVDQQPRQQQQQQQQHRQQQPQQQHAQHRQLEQHQEQTQQQQDGQTDGVDELFEDQEEDKGDRVDKEEDREGDVDPEEQQQLAEAGAEGEDEMGDTRQSDSSQQQQEQVAAAGRVSRKRPAGGGPGEERIPRQQQQQQQEQQDVPPGADAVHSAVREQVLAHVLGLLQPAVASGRLAPAQLARVATRASDKVCAAHAGAADAGFLAQHASSVARLVEKLLAHYAGLAPQPG